MSSQAPITLAFDLYGTLLSTSSIADELGHHFGEAKASSIASLWRRYQLEYTWRCNSMNIHIPFNTLTTRALTHALREHDLSLPPPQISALMEKYDSLSTFPDVAPALTALAQSTDIQGQDNAPALQAVVFSNGTASMVKNSVFNSPSLGGYARIFKDIITVEETRKYKPAPEVYAHLVDKLGRKNGEGKEGKEGGEGVWLVSGNPFDVVGAKKAGLRAVWVDREGKGWSDGLGEGEEWGGPDLVVGGLGEVVGGVRGFVGR